MLTIPININSAGLGRYSCCTLELWANLGYSVKKPKRHLGTVDHVYNPITWEAKTGWS